MSRVVVVGGGLSGMISAREIARRSRGTPRVANRLLRRVRDFALIRADARVTLPVARQTFALR